MSNALDLAGLHEAAAQNIDFISNFQQPNGQFISQRGQLDATGEALWIMAEHARLTANSSACATQLASMDKAVQWIADVTTADPLGLLPLTNPGDGELITGHITGDNIWTIAGLRSAISCALVASRPDLAAKWGAVDTRLEASLHTALTAAVARAGYIPPALDTSGGQEGNNYTASFPVQVISPTDPWVAATIAWNQKHSSEGLPTYDDGKSLHDYFSFSIFQTELSAGLQGNNPASVQAALDGFYAELGHTTSTDAGWEWNITPYGNRSSAQNLTPHDTFSADYVTFFRNLLITDTPTGVTLGAGVSPAWVKPGKKITVNNAPAGPSGSSGVVSYTLTGTSNGAVLQWSSTLGANVPLSWSLPYWARKARAGNLALSHVIPLNTASGALRVTWSGVASNLSYLSTTTALARAYRQHHQAPPFQLATR
jgi:hypothetical protein